MNPDRQLAIQYLSAPPDGPWRWAENGSVLEWQDGSTVAFREEIWQILEWLAPNGLPSFGAIVFLLAACRGKFCAVTDIVVESNVALPTGTGQHAAVLLGARQQLKAQLAAALEQFHKAARLPDELRTGIKARCVLAEAVFEPARSERHVDAAAVLRGLREFFDCGALVTATGRADGFIRQVHIVAEGLKLHTAESLALRMRTGLDALPKEIEADLPTAERARRLIEELSRDRDLGAVARAARELIAAVRLPRRLAEREELALGGVADITNRGPLDRLLLSELAHDDLTLAVRVALNEALYLRREPPMREPPGTLALLLDSGVRLWGIPRVLATAVALALVARDKQHSEVLAWRANGKQLESVNLLSRAGLRQHLGALETTAHPGEALAAFADAVAGGAQNQSVLITHRDTLDDPEFRRALAEQPGTPGFVAVVDRSGHFELHALPLARRTPVCEADLDLAAVFDDNVGVPPINVEVSPDLPAIFGVTPFPFLLPIAGKVDFSTKAADGCTYAVLNDRRLVQFRDPQTGGRVLTSDLPPGKTMWMEFVDGAVYLIKANASQRPVRLASCRANGTLRVFDLPAGSELLAVHRYGDVLLTLHHHDIRAYSLDDGSQLGRAINSHRWVHGRYVRGENQFYFAVWDGSTVKFEPVTLPNSYNPSVVPMIFDRTGVEGPWIVHHSGLIVSTAGGDQFQLPMPPGRSFGLDEVRVSRDGHRVLASMTSDWARWMDLKSGKVQTIPTRNIHHAHIEPEPPLPKWNLFRVLNSIARLPNGLAICGRRSHWRQIALNDRGTLHISEFQRNELEQLTHATAFGDERQVREQGCTLQTARWNNGSTAWVDSRGLLHLKSHDASVPEISLVLSHGEVAGWTSDGCVCGPGFFFEDTCSSQPKEVFARLLQFLSRL